MNFYKIIISILLLSTFYFLFSIFSVSAATNISSGAYEHWAWNDVIGWIDFYFDDVEVTSNELSGYASSSVGYIAFDCGNTPNGNICNPPTLSWSVTNDGSGNLSGWAWSEAIGWISFYCADLDLVPPICDQFNYRVTIDGSGNFSGWAWNDVVGWISFNCNNSGIGDTCATSNYKVKTSWSAAAATGTLVSSIFDTGVANGVAFNSIMWKGLQPAGTTVKFQFASASTTTGFPEPIGPGGTSLATDTYNPTGPDTPIALNRLYHNNHRYYRYKIILETNITRTSSPRVDDVFINWSP
jgi:hypothetical protein